MKSQLSKKSQDMSSKSKLNFAEAPRPRSKQEEIELEAALLSLKFLSEIEKFLLAGETPMNKKTLAERIGTSSSYVTQLFRGTKLINFNTIAKIQSALDITFEIAARPAASSVYEVDMANLSSVGNQREFNLWISFKKNDA